MVEKVRPICCHNFVKYRLIFRILSVTHSAVHLQYDMLMSIFEYRTNISQGSVAKYKRCGGVLNDYRRPIGNLLFNLPVKNFEKRSLFDEVMKLQNLLACFFAPPYRITSTLLWTAIITLSKGHSLLCPRRTSICCSLYNVLVYYLWNERTCCR